MPDPSPVTVTNEEPIAVVAMGDVDTPAQADARVLASQGWRDEEALTTAGQRSINRLWERTQAIIAISIVEVTLIVVAILIVSPVLRGGEVDQTTATAAVTGLVLLSNLVGNVTGSYFTRTNHSKVGGVSSTGPLRRGE